MNFAEFRDVIYRLHAAGYSKGEMQAYLYEDDLYELCDEVSFRGGEVYEDVRLDGVPLIGLKQMRCGTMAIVAKNNIFHVDIESMEVSKIQ